MCQGRPIVAVCACGASYADCDFVEAMCHITPGSGKAHRWVFLETYPFTAGRLMDESGLHHEQFLLLKYRRE